MVCDCTLPVVLPRWGAGRLKRLRRCAAHVSKPRRQRVGIGQKALRLRPPALPKRVYLVSQGCQGASCWRLEQDARSQPCPRGVARLAHSCRTCRVAALDAEWASHRPTEAGVALLQIAFWPSCEVFCLRLRAKDSRLPGKLPLNVRLLFRRGACGDALVVGFAIGQDVKRLWHSALRSPGSLLDLQPWCTPPRQRRAD